MSKKNKILKIQWIDSKYGGGWEFLDEITCKSAEVETIGYILEENSESITLAHSISDKQCCGKITIPKVCIKKSCEIE